jgi:hypothetical protein
LASRIWIDLEDLFRYSKLGQRPSGIQRLQFELCRALYVLPQSKGRAFFVRHDGVPRELVAIPGETIKSAHTLMTSRSSAELKAAALVAWARSALEEVTGALSAGLCKAVLLQIEVLVGLSRSMHARAAGVAGLLKRRGRSRNRRAAGYRELTDHFATTAEPGDVLAICGAAWVASDFTAWIERATRENGLRPALLIDDIIALRRPEWFKQQLANALRTWFGRMLSSADMTLTISAATGRDVREFKPLEWSDSARAVLKVHDTTEEASQAAEPELRRRA